MTTLEKLDEAAKLLGYERVGWDADNNCYSGFGSSDPTNRRSDSRAFVAWTPEELLEVIAKAK